MIYLLIILITLLLSAFFSGMEIAFVTSNKLKIELDKKQHKGFSRIIDIFTGNPSRYIATMLIGNNIALVVYGIVMAIVLEPLILKYISDSDILILAIQTILSTLIILVTAEFLPKTLFRINPNIALNVFAVPVMIFYILFYPITYFSILLSNNLLRTIFNIRISKGVQPKVFGKVDIDDFVSSHGPGKTEEIMEPDIKIFRNALDFSTIKLRECIVPRTEIEAIDVNETIEGLKQKFIETGYSKILVYKDSIDNIVGYVHSADLFKHPKTIRNMMRNILIVPETMPANKLLSDFIRENKSISVVVDEFGGTSGMVTIEDIIEEITGEIEDEHDVSELIERQVSDYEYVLSGRLEIDYLNDKFNLELPDSDDYETLAGLILFSYENIPKLNESLNIHNRDTIFKFKILEVSKTRIELVNLKIIKE